MNDATLALSIVCCAAVLGLGTGALVVKVFISPMYACPACNAPQRVYASGVGGRCGRCGQ